MSDSHRVLTPDVVIIPPTRIQERHFPACTSRFTRIEPFFCRGFLGSLVVLPILETFLLGAHQASKTGYNLNVFIFCTQSATCDRICALFSTLTANLSLFTAFLRVKASSLRSILRLFQLILIDVSRETRIFLAIFSINRAVHYSS